MSSSSELWQAAIDAQQKPKAKKVKKAAKKKAKSENAAKEAADNEVKEESE